MARRREKLRGGSVKTVENVHDVLGVVQTALLAQVKRGGVPLGPSEINAVMRKLWDEAKAHGSGPDAEPSESYEASQKRSEKQSSGDITSVVSALRVEGGGPPAAVSEGAPAREALAATVSWDGFSTVLASPFLDKIERGPEVGITEVPAVFVPIWERLLEMLAGEENMNKCRSKCGKLVSQVEGNKAKSPVELKRMIEDDEISFKALSYVFSKVIMRFEKFEKRRDWFVRMVNEELEEYDLPDLRGGGGQAWQFTDEAFVKLFRAIMVDEASNHPNSLMERVTELVWKQHDTKGIRVATGFLKSLGAQRKGKQGS
ncbi:MAG: hypothetical protein VX834_05925 [Myxococcota bacterium]|nr:hypothetical protein [Myxococcota bacterium]